MLLQENEPVVFAADGTAKLRFGRIVPHSLQLAAPDGSPLQEDTDFVVEEKAGRLTLRNKAVPTYSASPFYGKTAFDHTTWPDFGNKNWTCRTSYAYDPEGQPDDAAIAREAARTSCVLRMDKDIRRLIVFGDSISTGCDASDPSNAFFTLFCTELEKKLGHPVEMINAAVGGQTSRDGRKRFERDVLDKQPDLVLIGFGMNDQCRPRGQEKNDVPPEEFRDNIRYFLEQLYQAGSRVVLLGPCPSNLNWNWSASNFAEYTAVLKELAAEYNTPMADMRRVFEQILSRGMSLQALLHNDINHPGDYGHRLYALTLCALLE